MHNTILQIFSEPWDDHRVSKQLGDGLEVFGNATMVDGERWWNPISWVESVASSAGSWVESVASTAGSWVDSAVSDIGSALEDAGGAPYKNAFKRFPIEIL